ncbi:hypothetical protein JL722_4576 [Aureococcus anophagefferens]|nr:hypothetical protein JL722_4576 [Aureococcus anophagefferens]
MKLTLALATGAAASGNMNGPYTVSSGAGKTGVAFNSDYASKGHEYFDVYSPELATQYAEVFWTDMGKQPIPQAIIDRFANKTMASTRAITGYEMDMVMVSPLNAPGQHPENDVSVPINWAYNHHYEAWMTGKYSELRKIEHPDPADLTFHGSPKTLELVEADGARDALGDVPSSQWFSEGNGGESRKSFHGYPDGYAQLIGSPDAWHIEPMQIDTRNRECGVRPEDVGNCTKFEAWLEPKQARSGPASFRFWFQEYEPATATAKASHSDLPRYYYLTEQNAGEYDIPPAFRAPATGDPGHDARRPVSRRATTRTLAGMPGWPISTSSADLHLTPGTSCVGDCPGGPDCECEHTITSHFSMSNASMIYAGGHCHAPACISIELYKNDTGTPELLCRQVSVYGEGDVAADKFDEVGYVALPPCLWGSKDEGLEPPVFLGEDTPMFSITHTWNTYVGHTGQMASWQMRGVPFAATA